jgi:hypothetical protein
MFSVQKLEKGSKTFLSCRIFVFAKCYKKTNVASFAKKNFFQDLTPETESFDVLSLKQTNELVFDSKSQNSKITSISGFIMLLQNGTTKTKSNVFAVKQFFLDFRLKQVYSLFYS